MSLQDIKRDRVEIRRSQPRTYIRPKRVMDGRHHQTSFPHGQDLRIRLVFNHAVRPRALRKAWHSATKRSRTSSIVPLPSTRTSRPRSR